MHTMQRLRASGMDSGSLSIIATILLLGLSATTAGATDHRQKSKTSARIVQGVTGTPVSTLVNINNLSMWVRDDGLMERRPQDLNAGVTFPRGTTTVVYAGGLVWGGLVNDGTSPQLRVGGQTYNYGTVPGRIISKGVKESADDPSVRIYRVRRDWDKADLTQDAAEFFDKPLAQVTPADVDQVRLQYKEDWLQWPWQKGAPYYDRNGNGVYDPDPSGLYDPTKDEPGLGGADQAVWFVANDLDPAAARGLYGSPPIGIEMQVTCWGYARSDELGNVIFERYRIIYKGTASTPPNATIDSMYLCKWVDPDNGDYSDDFAGCVVSQSLGYDYNSSSHDALFDKFGLLPPVVGYVFFEGPRVPGAPTDFARWNLGKIAGYKNLPMTTFAYFAAGGHDSDPDLSNYAGTQQWYNLLRGYRPRPISPADCFHDPTLNGACTNFELSGDPISLSGWIDGRVDGPGDRRILLASGPITMALGDTQEVVVGLMGAQAKQGADYLEAIDEMRGSDVVQGVAPVAQDAFNLSFQLPDPVPTPSVRVVELDKKIILDWESDTAATRKLESYSSKGYNFETYKIYQYDGPTPSNDVKDLPPFDITTPRTRSIAVDKFRNRPLVNGQNYYFAVTATVFNPDPSLKKRRLESPVLIKVVVPHDPDPGVIYPYPIGEVVQSAQNIVGVNDAIVKPEFFDPTRPDGHSYAIPFHIDTTKVGTQNVTTKSWDCVDVTAQDTLLRRVLIDGGPQRLITRGMTVEVKSAPVGIKGVYQTRFNNQPTKDFVFGEPNPGGQYMILGELNGKGVTSLDTIKGANPDDRDFQWRFTGDSSWAMLRRANVLTSFWLRVPYTMWQIPKDTTLPAREVFTVITDEGSDSLWRPSVLLDKSYNGKTLKVFYPITVVPDSLSNKPLTYRDDIPTRPESGRVKAFLFTNSDASAIISGYVALFRVFIADLDEDGIAAPNGTVITFAKFKAVVNGDEKMISTQGVQTANTDAAKAAVARINVFPNPYYGINRAVTNRFRPYVTFNHLPPYAKIRIFNLAGTLVRTIIKQDDPSSTTQFATWDLQNANGLPVASGMYVAYLELRGFDPADKSRMIDLGTKTLKLMIVQEQQFLDNF